MSDDNVMLDRTELLQVAQDLNAIVVSLDRIGSAHADAAETDLAGVFLSVLDQWNVFAKLAHAREVLDNALLETADSDADRQALEEQLDRKSYWPNREARTES